MIYVQNELNERKTHTEKKIRNYQTNHFNGIKTINL